MRRFAMALLLGAAPPPGALNCSGCHGPANLPINGMAPGPLAATMTAYQSGELALTSMGRLMKGLTPDQVTAIAGWVAAQR